MASFSCTLHNSLNLRIMDDWLHSKANKHGWRLFTLYVRDGYGCWDVGAHFFVSREDGDTVVEAIKIIRSNCRRWTFLWIIAISKLMQSKKLFRFAGWWTRVRSYLLYRSYHANMDEENLWESSERQNGYGNAQDDKNWIQKKYTAVGSLGTNVLFFCQQILWSRITVSSKNGLLRLMV